MVSARGNLPFSVRNLFVVVITLKVLCSALAQYFHEPWFLGFWVPLTLMGIYIVVGLKTGPAEISKVELGDSCFENGFIFTISSIAFALFDIPELDKENRLTEIAVRFGAAMISTFLGMIVRVSMVGFSGGAQDQLDALDDKVARTTEDLRVRLELAAEAFKAYEQIVRGSIADTLTRTNLAIESAVQARMDEFARTLTAIVDQTSTALGNNLAEIGHAVAQVKDETARVLGDVAEQTRQALESNVAEVNRAVKQSGEGLALASNDIGAKLKNVSDNLRETISELSEKLRISPLPGDVFAAKLDAPVAALATRIATVENAVSDLVVGLNSAGRALESAIGQFDRELVSAKEALATTGEIKDLLVTVGARVIDAGKVVEGVGSEFRNDRQLLIESLEKIDVVARAASDVTAGSIQASEELRSAGKALTEAVGRIAQAPIIPRGGAAPTVPPIFNAPQRPVGEPNQPTIGTRGPQISSGENARHTRPTGTGISTGSGSVGESQRSTTGSRTIKTTQPPLAAPKQSWFRRLFGGRPNE